MANAAFKVLTALLINGVVGISLAYSGHLAGVWQTHSDKTGEAESLIRVTDVNGKIEGTIEQIFSPPAPSVHPLCDACTGPDKDKPIVGMKILHAVILADPTRAEGDILDPDDGQLYKCKLHVINDTTLEVRGYIGVPLFGRTQTWTRHH